jgi:glyoxylase-like metal-dependent hydrolase (beta-lactamase superfamily II)
MEVVPGLHWVERIWDTKVYLLFEADRLIVIDAATPGRAGVVWRHLRDLGYAPQDVDEIWLTHGDIDHMGSVAALKAGSGAQVVAHRADVPLVEGRAPRELGPVPLSGTWQRLFNWAVRRIFEPTTVDCPVEDGASLGDWRVVHVPGHTPGSVCYHHPERGIAIVGDAINYRRSRFAGEGRLGAPPLTFSSDMSQAYRSVQKIAALEPEVCCFGHGPPLTEGAAGRVHTLAVTLSRE